MVSRLSYGKRNVKAMFIEMLDARSPIDEPDESETHTKDGEIGGHSTVFAFILCGIVGAASLVGIFFAQETPLTDLPWQTTENVAAPQQSEPGYFR